MPRSLSPLLSYPSYSCRSTTAAAADEDDRLGGCYGRADDGCEAPVGRKFDVEEEIGGDSWCLDGLFTTSGCSDETPGGDATTMCFENCSGSCCRERCDDERAGHVTADVMRDNNGNDVLSGFGGKTSDCKADLWLSSEESHVERPLNGFCQLPFPASVSIGQRRAPPPLCSVAATLAPRVGMTATYQPSGLPPRPVVPADTVLRIRTIGPNSSCRSIRATLLQIRDSMKAVAAASSSDNISISSSSSSSSSDSGTDTSSTGRKSNDIDACKSTSFGGGASRPEAMKDRCDNDNSDDDESDDSDDSGTSSSVSDCPPLVPPQQLQQQHQVSAAATTALPSLQRADSVDHWYSPRRDHQSAPTTPPLYYGRRHKKCLTSDDDYDDERLSGTTSTSTLVGRRRRALRRQTSVKFADEFGLNLNTFVMIPSRTKQLAAARIPATRLSAESVAAAAAAASWPTSRLNGVAVPFEPSIYLQLVRAAAETPMSTTGGAIPTGGAANAARNISDDERGPSSCNCGCERPLDSTTTTVVVAPVAGQSALQLSPDEFSITRTAARTETGDEDPPARSSPELPPFRLCFDQPFASQDRFTTKLAAHMICLENVRVEDWSPGGGGGTPLSPSQQAPSCPPGSPQPAGSRLSPPPPTVVSVNSVMLCTIRVRNLHPEKRVFARCTDNDWKTFADLPAQHVGNIDSLGYEHDRFCFAVRRPSSASSWHSTGPCLVDSSSGSSSPADGCSSGGAAAAVEFAVCFQAAGKVFWDNNDGENYRIEWF